jgi:hypothetical protein
VSPGKEASAAARETPTWRPSDALTRALATLLRQMAQRAEAAGDQPQREPILEVGAVET